MLAESCSAHAARNSWICISCHKPNLGIVLKLDYKSYFFALCISIVMQVKLKPEISFTGIV